MKPDLIKLASEQYANLPLLLADHAQVLRLVAEELGATAYASILVRIAGDLEIAGHMAQDRDDDRARAQVDVARAVG